MTRVSNMIPQVYIIRKAQNVGLHYTERATAAENRFIKHCMDHTTHAWMRGDYGERRWRREIRFLMSLDCDEIEIQAVLLSKWMRWADHGGPGHHRIASLMTKWPHEYGRQAIQDLVGGFESSDLVPLPENA